jgi:hypothetical protein
MLIMHRYNASENQSNTNQLRCFSKQWMLQFNSQQYWMPVWLESPLICDTGIRGSLARVQRKIAFRDICYTVLHINRNVNSPHNLLWLCNGVFSHPRPPAVYRNALLHVSIQKIVLFKRHLHSWCWELWGRSHVPLRSPDWVEASESRPKSLAITDDLYLRGTYSNIQKLVLIKACFLPISTDPNGLDIVENFLPAYLGTRT